MKALEFRSRRSVRIGVSSFPTENSLAQAFSRWWQEIYEESPRAQIEPVTRKQILEVFSSSYLGDLPSGPQSMRADFEWQFEEYFGLISTELEGEAGAFNRKRRVHPILLSFYPIR